MWVLAQKVVDHTNTKLKSDRFDTEEEYRYIRSLVNYIRNGKFACVRCGWEKAVKRNLNAMLRIKLNAITADYGSDAASLIPSIYTNVYTKAYIDPNYHRETRF